MKSIILSCTPTECEKIVNGDVSILVRKKVPNETPFKVYIYCTKDKPYLYRVDDDDNFELARTLRPYVDEYVKDYNEQNGKVIGEFICDKVYNLVNAFGGIMFADENLNQLDPQLFRDMSCLTDEQTADYLGNKDGYGLHITALKIYDNPKELNEFKTGCKGCKERDTYHCKFYCYGERPLTRPPQNYIYVEE